MGRSLVKFVTSLFSAIKKLEELVIPIKNAVVLQGEILDVGIVLLFSEYLGISSSSFQKSRILHNMSPEVRLLLSNLLLETVKHIHALRNAIDEEIDFPIEVVYRFFAVDLLYEIFLTEYKYRNNCRFIEHLCLSQLHDLISAKQLSIDSAQLLDGFLFKSLQCRFELSNDDFSNHGKGFLKSLKKFLGNLSCECTPEQSDEYVNGLMRMLRFLKQIRHRGLFVTYVHQLYQHHLAHKNYVEAAMVLMQESELLAWRTNVFIENAAVYSLDENCTEFELNEQIHLTCIKLLDIAQFWERALELTRVLEHQYGLKVHDYRKLSEVLKIRVALYEKIFQEHRTFPTYFRVAFLGDGFGDLMGKQFIYRGDNWEQLGSFCDRLSGMYSPVNFNHSKAPVDPCSLRKGDRIIQLNVVEAVSDIRSWSQNTFETDEFRRLSWSIGKKSSADFKDVHLFLFTPELYWENSEFQELLSLKERIPAYVKSYYENNEISMFSLARPFKKEVPSDNIEDQNAREFANLWIEKTIFFTEYSLPCQSRRSKVIQTMTFEVSPIENAIVTMRMKTKELLAFERKYQQLAQRSTIDTMNFATQDSKWSIDTAVSTPSNPPESKPSVEVNINPFSMALQGAIDAPVNGGVSLYKSAFLNNPSFQNSSNQSLCKTLESAIMEQVIIFYNRWMLFLDVYLYMGSLLQIP
jgi:hypothetical protein